jgi:hypothetical protein
MVRDLALLGDKMFVYHPGFFSRNGGFQALHEADQSVLETELYQSWIDFAGTAVDCRNEIQNQLMALPNETTVFASENLLDSAVRKMAGEIRDDLRFRTLTRQDLIGDQQKLFTWTRENQQQLFLTDAKTAVVLYYCERLLAQGDAVACIGPFPEIQDVTWRYSREIPLGTTMENEPRWSVRELAKTASAFLLARRFKRFTPNLVLGCVKPFSEWLDFPTKSGTYRALGTQRVRGAALSRHLMQGQCAETTEHQLLSAEEVALYPILKRSPKANRFYTPVERYVDSSFF